MMDNTPGFTFEKLDELVKDLDIIELSQNDEKHHPEKYTQWNKIIDDMPEKTRKEYMQSAYDKAKQKRKTKTEHKEQILQTLPYPQSDLKWTQAGQDLNIKEIEKLNNNGIIREEVETVFFAFKQAHKKPKEFQQAFDFCNYSVQEQPSCQNLYYPEEVTIDYSEYCDIPKFKDNIFAKSYKDGIMLVADVAKGDRMAVSLTVGTVKNSFNIDGKIVAKICQQSFRNFGQIDWTHKNFDKQIVFYVVVPKIVKNKALRIIFKNNTRLNKLIKLFRKDTLRKLPPGKFKYFYDDAAPMQDILAALLICQKDEKYKKNYNYNNKELLDASYKSILIELANNGAMLAQKDAQEYFWTSLEKYRKKSLEEIKQEYMKEIFPFEKDLDLVTIQNLDSKDKRCGIYLKKSFLKMVILYYHTNKGTTLCDNTLIEIKNKTQSDCILFWKKVDLCELLFNVLNKHNFPLCMRDSQILNNVNIFDPVLNNHMSLSPITNTPENETDKKTFEFKNKHIVVEAMESQTGYLMPYDGVWEIPHDLTFSSLKFREYEDFITILLFDHEERYFIEIFSKTEVDFKYMLWNQFKLNDNYSEDCLQEIYTKIAVCIRDSKVLIERDSTMQYQGRRKPYGSNTDSIYEIWMPRRRYHRKYSKTQAKQDKDFFSESRIFSGSRRAHPRRLPAGSKPSKLQLLLAKNENMILNPGETYVKQSMWGDKAMPQRERRYRHRSLSGNFYFDNKEMSEAKKLGSMSGPQFEEYCDKYISERGWKIYKRKNYDGGIDLRAWNKEGPIKTLLIQCKHWNTPIPPGAMKEFKASCDEEKVQGEKVLMFMAFGKYSPGARKYAEKYNIELIEGDHFLNDLE